MALALAGLEIPAEVSAQSNSGQTAEVSLQFIVGVPTPEDLVQIPGSDWIIGSGLADFQHPVPFSGNLVLINSKSRTASVVAIDPENVARAPYTACSAPPDAASFSAHGLDIRPEGQGKATLFVVGHGAREAIEVFEIDTNAAMPKATWIGCVPAIEGAFNNAVVALPDDRILVTDFLHGGTSFDDLYAGRVTGAVYSWTPGGTFKKLPGTDMSGPNGLAVTADQRYMFVSDNGTNTVRRYALAATYQPPVVIRPGIRTDNIRWSPDGQLLLAGPVPDPKCAATPATCHETQAIKLLDPATLAVTPMIAFPGTASFDYLSSALILDDTLWLGSPNGTGVAYTRLP